MQPCHHLGQLIVLVITWLIFNYSQYHFISTNVLGSIDLKVRVEYMKEVYIGARKLQHSSEDLKTLKRTGWWESQISPNNRCECIKIKKTNMSAIKNRKNSRNVITRSNNYSQDITVFHWLLEWFHPQWLQEWYHLDAAINIRKTSLTGNT